MPSSRKAVRAILNSVPERAEVIYELGCGWGNLIFPLAKRFKRAHVVGYELSPVPWGWSWLMQKVRRASNVTLYRKNFLQASLQEADVVVCYLYPGVMVKLKEKFERELKPGTWVISNAFAIRGWEPVEVIHLEGMWRGEVFVYSVPVPCVACPCPKSTNHFGHGHATQGTGTE